MDSTVKFMFNSKYIPVPGFRRTWVFKAQPNGFFGFYWVLGFIGFSDLLVERVVGKLVG